MPLAATKLLMGRPAGVAPSTRTSGPVATSTSDGAIGCTMSQVVDTRPGTVRSSAASAPLATP